MQEIGKIVSIVKSDRKVHATHVYKRAIAETSVNQGNKYVASKRDQLDYFAEIIMLGKNDFDFILDVFPHEVMHIFIPGSGAIAEGVTERLTRKAADKYGLRMTPTSHSKETNVIARIEAIVGRNAISSISLSNEQKSMLKSDFNIDKQRYEELKQEIDRKMGEGTFNQLKTILDKEYNEILSYKTKTDEFQKYRNESFNEILAFLDKWIEENANKLQLSEYNRKLNVVQEDAIDLIQDKENLIIYEILEKYKIKDRDIDYYYEER